MSQEFRRDELETKNEKPICSFFMNNSSCACVWVKGMAVKTNNGRPKRPIHKSVFHWKIVIPFVYDYDDYLTKSLNCAFS